MRRPVLSSGEWRGSGEIETGRWTLDRRWGERSGGGEKGVAVWMVAWCVEWRCGVENRAAEWKTMRRC